MKKIHISMAAFPGWSVADAMDYAADGTSEPIFGLLSLDETQLCPQNRGRLTEELCAMLRERHPETRMRLHANVQVLDTRMIMDLSRWNDRRDYWEQLSRISRALDAPAYSAHAGRRSEASLAEVLNATRACEDLMGIPVAVEGHYPAPSGDFHIATLDEYQAVMESGVRYVIDFSHLHICSVAERRRDMALLKALVENDHCLEVHVSDNNGRRDEHRLLQHTPWWWPAMEHIHEGATVFSEGSQLENVARTGA